MVDDFIHNLRNQSKRKQSYNNPYKPPGNRNGNVNRRPEGRRFGDDQLSELIGETLPAIRNLLKDMTDHQKRLVEVEEMRVRAEERMAAAMESIALQFRIPEPPKPAEEVEEIIEPIGEAQPVEPEKLAPEGSDPPDKDRILAIIAGMRNNGATYDQIAFHLAEEKVPTLSGRGRWHPQTVHRACRLTQQNQSESDA